MRTTARHDYTHRKSKKKGGGQVQVVIMSHRKEREKRSFSAICRLLHRFSLDFFFSLKISSSHFMVMIMICVAPVYVSVWVISQVMGGELR